MKRIQHNPEDPYNFWPQYLYSDNPTLSEVVKDLEWGNNQLIRDGGVKIADKVFIEYTLHKNLFGKMILLPHVENDCGLWKDWPRVSDPFFKIKSGTMVGSGKIPKFVIIWVGNDEDYI